MLKSLGFLSLLTTVSLAAAQASPQSADPAQIASDSQPAPIVRAYASGNAAQYPSPERRAMAAPIVDTQPISGVWLRSESTGVVKTISANQQGTEIRLEHGRLNVNVHHPAGHAAILIDMPGGQISLLKDGLYTFNADTNTVRVLRGEAAAFPGVKDSNPNPNVSKIKVKEDHQLSLTATTGGIKPTETDPYEITADLLPLGEAGGRGYADYEEEGYPPLAYPYAYPYYAYGYGYPGFYPGFYGYPLGYGIGFGYGYYGGFRGGYGGYRGFRR